MQWVYVTINPSFSRMRERLHNILSFPQGILGTNSISSNIHFAVYPSYPHMAIFIWDIVLQEWKCSVMYGVHVHVYVYITCVMYIICKTDAN